MGDTGVRVDEPSEQVWLDDPTHYRGTRVHIVGFLLGLGSHRLVSSISYGQNYILPNDL
jgi:hypothetical protein